MTAAEIAARDQLRAQQADENRARCRERGRHFYSRINEHVCLLCGHDDGERPTWWGAP